MVKTWQRKVWQPEGVRTEADIQRFLRLIGNIERGIRNKVFYPNEAYMCGICGYGPMREKW